MAADAGRLFGRGISFPPRIGPGGRMLWSEGEANVRESIRVILMTDLKERVRLPDFGCGLRQFLFEPNTATTQRLIQDRITKALELWEPRISLESVEVREDPQDPQAVVATISYKLVANQVRERLSVGVRLGG